MPDPLSKPVDSKNTETFEAAQQGGSCEPAESWSSYFCVSAGTLSAPRWAIIFNKVSWDVGLQISRGGARFPRADVGEQNQEDL